MKLAFLERARVLAPLKHALVVDVGMWLQLRSHDLAKRSKVLGPRRELKLVPNLQLSVIRARPDARARMHAAHLHAAHAQTRAHAHSHTHTRARACTHARASTHPAIERGAIGHAASEGAECGGCYGADRARDEHRPQGPPQPLYDEDESLQLVRSGRKYDEEEEFPAEGAAACVHLCARV